MSRSGSCSSRVFSALLCALTSWATVAVPVLERDTLVSRPAAENQHDPSQCPHGHDHTVCTQVSANHPLSTAGSGHRLSHVVARLAPPREIRSSTGASALDGPRSRAPPLA